jgi:DNA-binding NarL/FixJ family response regulator
MNWVACYAAGASGCSPPPPAFPGPAVSGVPAACAGRNWRPWRAYQDIFSQLGAAPWAARASSELRATGQLVAEDQRPDPVTLTPQQREIAGLAAAGLTNKQIGERLYLSHRTVATYLYQIFPKLGVTSRAALRDALSRSEDRKQADL